MSETKIEIDTSGEFTINLPPNPSIGDKVVVRAEHWTVDLTGEKDPLARELLSNIGYDLEEAIDDEIKTDLAKRSDDSAD